MPYETATPESVGLDSARLRVLTEWQERMVAAGKLPMSEVLIARRGKVVYRQGCGEEKPGTPLSEASRFRIYSMTKPIATCALMTLYEQGKFQLEDPVSLYLGPKWRKENMKVFVSGTVDDYVTEPCTKSITCRMMMNHTSGLSYGFDATGATNPVDGLYFKHKRGMYDSVNLEKMVDGLAEMPLFFQPGSAWNYSLGIDVVGRLVEAISGEPFEDYMERVIFKPLGMPVPRLLAREPARSEHAQPATLVLRRRFVHASIAASSAAPPLGTLIGSNVAALLGILSHCCVYRTALRCTAGMDCTSFWLDAEAEKPLLCELYSPKFDMTRGPPAEELPPGGMMALMMDPENRFVIEDLFDGLAAVDAGEDGVSHAPPPPSPSPLVVVRPSAAALSLALASCCLEKDLMLRSPC